MKKFALIALGMLVFAGVSKMTVEGMKSAANSTVTTSDLSETFVQLIRDNNWEAVRGFLGMLSNHSIFISQEALGTAVLAAARDGNKDLLKKLKDVGAPIHAIVDEHGDSPLHLAIKNKQEKAYNWILKQENKRNIKNAEGKTPDGLTQELGLTELSEEIQKHKAYKKEPIDYTSITAAVPLYPSEACDFSKKKKKTKIIRIIKRKKISKDTYPEVEAKLIDNDNDNYDLNNEHAQYEEDSKSRTQAKQSVDAKSGVSQEEIDLMHLIGESEWASARRAYNALVKKKKLSLEVVFKILKFLAKHCSVKIFSQWYYRFEKDGLLRADMMVAVLDRASPEVSEFIENNGLVGRLIAAEKSARKTAKAKKKLLDDDDDE